MTNRRTDKSSLDIIHSKLDILSTLEFLHEKTHPGVRDYLINKLYDISDSDIDYVLPQLCFLSMIWDDTSSSLISSYLEHLGSRSMHMTTKLIWILQAQEAYANSPRESYKCVQLAKSVEMAHVNASLAINNSSIDNKFLHHRHHKRRHKHTNPYENSQRPSSSLHTSKSADIVVQFSLEPHPIVDVAIETTTTAAHSPADGTTDTDASLASSFVRVVLSPSKRMNPYLATPFATSSAPQSAPGSPSFTPTVSNGSSYVPSADITPLNLTPPHSPSNVAQTTPQCCDDTPTSNNCSTPPLVTSSLTEAEMFLMLSKQVRSDYFNSELVFLSALQRISEALRIVPHTLRNDALRRYMNNLDSKIARGLYFPLQSTGDRHYKILRLLPNECMALSSRDKAPYLLHVEIAYTGITFYDDNLYIAFKSNEEIMSEATGVTPIQVKEPVDESDLVEMKDIPNDEKSQVRKSLTPSSSSQGPTRPSTADNSDKSWSISDSTTNNRVSDGGRLVPSVDSPTSPHSANSHIPRTPAKTTQNELLIRNANQSPINAQPISRSQSLSSGISSARIPTDAPTAAGSQPGSPNVVGATHAARTQSVSLSRPLPPTTLQLKDVPWEILDRGFGEPWESRKERIRAASPNGADPNWDLLSVIFKSGDDLRQEVLAYQLITLFNHIFTEARLPLWLRPYSVIVTAADAGLIETVPNAVSIDSLKKNVPGFTTLKEFFDVYHGPPESKRHIYAVRNFIESTAAYSIVCYLLQIKDRHNGNILIDRDGHIIHIDYGFMLSNSPGGNWNFENVPFKLTDEYISVMGGIDSDLFKYFRFLVVRGFLEVRPHAPRICVLLSIMMKSKMPCFCQFDYNEATLQYLRDRFCFHMSEDQVMKFAESLVDQSIDNWRTIQYDKYQKKYNNID